MLLLTTHADCAPLIIYDPLNKILGQAHAGWRGLADGIVEHLITNIRSLNGYQNINLFAWIGPTVRPCCYPVNLDVAGRFPEECWILVGDTMRLDLVRFIRRELERLNFDSENVADSGICTSCAPQYSSFRRDGMHTHAMACVTGLHTRDYH